MSFNRAQWKALRKPVQVLIHAGVFVTEEDSIDYMCQVRKRVMRKQRARRKAKRGWA